MLLNSDIGEPVSPEEIEEDQGTPTKSRFDKIWDRLIDAIYDVFDDFSEIPAEDRLPAEVEPLNMKT